jgi:hypothetical protein
MVSSSGGGQNIERTVIYVADLRSTIHIYIKEVRGGTSHRPRPKILVIEANMVFSFINPKRHKMGSHVSVYF